MQIKAGAISVKYPCADNLDTRIAFTAISLSWNSPRSGVMNWVYCSVLSLSKRRTTTHMHHPSFSISLISRPQVSTLAAHPNPIRSRSRPARDDPKACLWRLVRQSRQFIWCATGFFLFCQPLASAQAPQIRPSKSGYGPGESITVTFQGGPGNARDWIGIYPLGVKPGSTPSTLWFYVNGSSTATTGLTSGSVTFASGLSAAGTYEVHLLRDDGYAILATAMFAVGTPQPASVKPVTSRSWEVPFFVHNHDARFRNKARVSGDGKKLVLVRQPSSKVSGYGLTTWLSGLGKTAPGTADSPEVFLYDLDAGTYLYMAPELLAGKSASKQSDLYSLGVVLYQLLVGDLSRPITTDWSKEIVDPVLREDLARCTSGNPVERFSSAAALAQDLRSLEQRRVRRDLQEALQQAEHEADQRRRAQELGRQFQVACDEARRADERLQLEVESRRSWSSENRSGVMAATSDLADAIALATEQANMLLLAGQWDKALALHAYVLDTRIRVLGPEHPNMLSSMNSLGAVYRVPLARQAG